MNTALNREAERIRAMTADEKIRLSQAPSLVGLFVAPLNRSGIEYMVTGGLASVVYGHPRLTLDVDLVSPCSTTGSPGSTSATSGRGRVRSK
jgi:hypothetical protein